MLPPDNKSIPVLAREEGIAEQTLYNWRQAARQQGRLLPSGESGPEGWSSIDMFNAVIETAGLNEEELGRYCRQKGLYPAQIRRWREACENANDWDRAQLKINKEQVRTGKRKIQELETELRRKEKALAETAALLVLKKKVQNLWPEDVVA